MLQNSIDKDKLQWYKKRKYRGNNLPNNSGLKLCFLLSLSLHFSLVLFPFFAIPPAQGHRPPNFLEIIFLNKKAKRTAVECKNETGELEAGNLGISRTKKTGLSGITENFISSVVQNNHKEESRHKTPAPKCRELDLSGKDDLSFGLFSDYADILRVCILNKAVYPELAFKKDMEGTVQLKFVLLPDGHLKNVYVINSSNFPALDAAAINAVERAVPFPPFPEKLKTKELFVKVPIVYKRN